MRRRNFTLPKRHKHDESADSQACNKPCDEIHCQADRTSLKTAANNSEYACQEHGLASTELVSDGPKGQCADEATTLEESIDCANERSCVTSCVETEIMEKGWLAEG